MFTGSGHVPYGLHDKLTEGVGGQNNGTTSNDRTTYFETVPSNYLESALWLEADRMGFLLDTLDVAKLNAQRDIVKNERRQGVDNQPYGRVDEILARRHLPADRIPTRGMSSAAWRTSRRRRSKTSSSSSGCTTRRTTRFSPSSATSIRRRRRRGSTVLRRHPEGRADHAARRRAGDAAPRRGSSTRITCRCRGCTCSGRRSARRSDDRFALDVLGRHPERSAHGAADQGARVRSAGSGDRGSRSVHQGGRRRIPDRDHASSRATRWRISNGRRRDLEKLKATGRPRRRFRRPRPAKSSGSSRPAVESRQGIHARRRRRLPQRPWLLPDGIPESSAVTAADVKRVANKYLTAGRVVLSIVPLGKLDQAAKPERAEGPRRRRGGRR